MYRRVVCLLGLVEPGRGERDQQVRAPGGTNGGFSSHAPPSVVDYSLRIDRYLCQKILPYPPMPL